MEPSDACLRLIADHEGCVLHPYRDRGGVLTIGIGHVILPGENFGSGITAAKALELLRADTAKAVDTLHRLVRVPLTQNQFDALVDFVFNIGQGQFITSTLRMRLNMGDYAAAANQFKRWVYDDGVKVEGLVKRRADEAALFRTV